MVNITSYHAYRVLLLVAGFDPVNIITPAKTLHCIALHWTHRRPYWYRARRAFLPAVVSTSGRIHGELHFRALDEAIDADSEAYCWRRSGFFWRMRASLGLACAQATTLSSQVFGKGNLRSRAGRPSV